MPDNRSNKNQNQKAAVNTADKPVFVWSAPAFVQYSKNSQWFLIVSLIAIALAGLFVYLQNWTAVGVVVAAALALILQARAKPKDVDCALFRDGFVIDDKAYRYDDLKSFWIVFSDHPFARFAPARRFSASINMPIAEEDPEQIRLFLAKYLPEDEDKGEDITDTVQRWLRF